MNILTINNTKMNATEKKYVEKLKELIEHVGGTDPEYCHKCKEMLDEISALESQSEESYPREFVEWYSGMEFIKIDSASKRWKREKGNWKSKVKPK